MTDVYEFELLICNCWKKRFEMPGMQGTRDNNKQ